MPLDVGPLVWGRTILSGLSHIFWSSRQDCTWPCQAPCSHGASSPEGYGPDRSRDMRLGTFRDPGASRRLRELSVVSARGMDCSEHSSLLIASGHEGPAVQVVNQGWVEALTSICLLVIWKD
jgi:hypothetical protein